MKLIGMALLAAACVFAVGCTATTGTATAPGATEPTAVGETEKVAEGGEADEVVAVGSQVVCSREHVVGTRFKKTVCKTREQMEDERQGAQDALRRHQDAFIGEMTTNAAGGG